jgi:hypothetical protein
VPAALFSFNVIENRHIKNAIIFALTQIAINELARFSTYFLEFILCVQNKSDKDYSKQFFPLLKKLELRKNTLLTVTIIHGSALFFNREKQLLIIGINYIKLFKSKMVIYTNFMHKIKQEKSDVTDQFQNHALLVSSFSLFFDLFSHSLVTCGMSILYYIDLQKLNYTLLVVVSTTYARKKYSG